MRPDAQSAATARLKSLLRAHVPWLSTVHRRWHLARVAVRQRGSGRPDLFDYYYAANVWNAEQSRSGPGSTAQQTTRIRRELPALFDELGIGSLVDAPCGDLAWMRLVQHDLDSYIGCDIVEELIEELSATFAAPGTSFQRLDVVCELPPRADAILSRDSLVHFSYEEVFATLRNFQRSGSTFLITTTFPERKRNRDIRTGDWRPLNLERAPFSFPPPVRLIVEGCTEDGGRWSDKSLGVWRLADLSLPLAVLATHVGDGATRPSGFVT
jgi:hypothetical protein